MGEFNFDPQAYAKKYIGLFKAFREQGIPEEEARLEARMSALLSMYVDTNTENEGTCPFCGHEKQPWE